MPKLFSIRGNAVKVCYEDQTSETGVSRAARRIRTRARRPVICTKRPCRVHVHRTRRRWGSQRWVSIASPRIRSTFDATCGKSFGALEVPPLEISPGGAAAPWLVGGYLACRVRNVDLRIARLVSSKRDFRGVDATVEEAA